MATATATAAVDDGRTGNELFDADGHVIEDVQGSSRKMPSRWGDAMRGRFTNPLGQLHGMTILPWLGFLSTIPTGWRERAHSREGPEASTATTPSRGSTSSTTVGIERTVLYPTLGLTDRARPRHGVRRGGHARLERLDGGDLPPAPVGPVPGRGAPPDAEAGRRRSRS